MPISGIRCKRKSAKNLVDQENEDGAMSGAHCFHEVAVRRLDGVVLRRGVRYRLGAIEVSLASLWISLSISSDIDWFDEMSAETHDSRLLYAYRLRLEGRRTKCQDIVDTNRAG